MFRKACSCSLCECTPIFLKVTKEYARSGLIYSPLVPFISAFATSASFLLFIIHQVQACTLFSTESETGGRFWLRSMDLVLVFTLLAQGMLALTCALQSADVKKAMMV